MTRTEPEDHLGVYGITTAAALTGVPVPTLRLYERRGLVAPARTEGGTRRYSRDDVAVLGRIAVLVSAGVNLAGVAHVLALQADNTALVLQNEQLQTENTRLHHAHRTT